MTWWISIPIWGLGYHLSFLHRSYYSLRYALLQLPQEVRETIHLVIHTDYSDRYRRLFPEFRTSFMEVSEAAKAEGTQAQFQAYVDAHNEVVKIAAIGDWFSCLNADFAYSGNFFRAIHQYLASGALAVTVMGMRTRTDLDYPPVGASPGDLLAWGWAHRHTIAKENVWGQGHSDLPSHLFWERPPDNEHFFSVVGHGFHLHPVGVVKEKDFRFESIDADVLAYHDRSKIHVVTSPDDLALIEMSPSTKVQATRAEILNDPSRVAQVLRSWSDPQGLYRWQFAHRIVLVGDGGGVDEMPVVEQILRELG